MSDPFSNLQTTLTSPARSHYQINPSDMDPLPVKPRAIYVNASGTAVIEDASGSAVTYDLVLGSVLTIRPVKVHATGTTAQLTAWY